MINVEELTQNAIDGIESPFIALSELKRLKNKIDLAIKEVEPIAIQEAEKYDKNFEINGLKMELRQGRKVWNFKNLEEWNTYNKGLKDCEERYKSAYSSFEKGLSAISQDGELLELPEVTYTKPSLIIKEVNK